MSPVEAVYTCTFPGCPCPVTVSASVIENLQRLRENGGEGQGVLYGRARADGTAVVRCDPVPKFEAEAMRAATSDGAVGYYRIRIAEELQLRSDELTIAEELFSREGFVVLLASCGPAEGEANFFFRESGALVNFPLLSFPLDVSKLHLQVHRIPAPDIATDPLPLTALTSDRAVEHRPGKRIVAPVLVCCLAAASATIGAMVYAKYRKPAPASTPLYPTVARPSSRLPLRAERLGSDLKLVWNADSLGTANIASGIIEIEDGKATRRIALDTAQVRFGTVLYSPVSDQVSIHLTVVKHDGTAAQASVLVIQSIAGIKETRPPTRAVPIRKLKATKEFVPPTRRTANRSARSGTRCRLFTSHCGRRPILCPSRPVRRLSRQNPWSRGKWS